MVYVCVRACVRACVCVRESGPSKATSSDLWHMVWQLHSSRIIMLANLTEDGRVRTQLSR